MPRETEVKAPDQFKFAKQGDTIEGILDFDRSERSEWQSDDANNLRFTQKGIA